MSRVRLTRRGRALSEGVIVLLASTLMWALLLAAYTVGQARADTSLGVHNPRGPAYADARYGRSTVLRTYQRTPRPVTARRQVVVSFKYPAGAVVAGKYDAALRAWFATLPHVRVWWSYWHEPENDYPTRAAQRTYRAAWQRIAAIAEKYAPRPAQATYIGTMHSVWTGTWSRWYPGDRVIDVLGFDGKVKAWDRRYVPARVHYAAALDLARRHGKPWGLAEYGSTVFRRDYAGRAAWMRDTARWLRSNNARYAVWWDQKDPNTRAGDFRLTDRPSIRAMRWMVTL